MIKTNASAADFANGAHAPNGVRVVGRPIGTSHIVRIGAVVAFSAAVALLGLLNWPVATTARSHGGPQASAVSSNAVTMDIVPAPATDSSSGRFVGTGDGSAGSWIRP